MKFVPIVDDAGNAYLVSADKIRQIVIENYSNTREPDRARIEFVDGFTQRLRFDTKAKSHGLFIALSDRLNRSCCEGEQDD